MKPVKAKPSLYAHYFEILKRVALTYGYNLVLHGSMDRDLDLIAIPWEEETGSVAKMIAHLTKTLGPDCYVLKPKDNEEKPHGRIVYIIHLSRNERTGFDFQYYLDISIMPTKRKK